MLNKILLHKRRKYIHIEIKVDESSWDNSLDFLFQAITEMARDKNLFVSFDGEIDCVSKDNVFCQQNDEKNLFRSKLWINSEWLTHARKFCDDVERFDIYLFDKEYKWSSFLHESRSNDSYIGGEPNLYMVASFGQCQFPSILIKKDILVIKQISDYYFKQGFKIVDTWL